MGAWNILSPSEDHRLPHLPAELREFRVYIVLWGPSETRRPENGDIRRGSYIYYWSGPSDDARLNGVAIAFCSRLQSSFAGVTSVDERMMVVKLTHTFGFIYFIAVYTT